MGTAEKIDQVILRSACVHSAIIRETLSVSSSSKVLLIKCHLLLWEAKKNHEKINSSRRRLRPCRKNTRAGTNLHQRMVTL